MIHQLDTPVDWAWKRLSKMKPLHGVFKSVKSVDTISFLGLDSGSRSRSGSLFTPRLSEGSLLNFLGVQLQAGPSLWLGAHTMLETCSEDVKHFFGDDVNENDCCFFMWLLVKLLC